MGDKTKLKLGSLGANVMEENLLSQFVERVCRQHQSKVTDIEKQQTALVNKFQDNLKRSAKIAREHERLQLQLEVVAVSAPAVSTARYIWSSVPYMRIDSADNRSQPNGKLQRNTNSALHDHIEVKSDSCGKPHLKLPLRNDNSSLRKAFHTSKDPRQDRPTPGAHSQSCQGFLHPYQGDVSRFSPESSDPPYKRNSVTKDELSRPATRLEIRSLMWQKTIHHPESRIRAKSAPAWTRRERAPARIVRAQDKAAQLSCLSSNLLQPPCKQAQIDLCELREKREREVHRENEAVKRFSSTLKPYTMQQSSGRLKMLDVAAYYCQFASSV